MNRRTFLALPLTALAVLADGKRQPDNGVLPPTQLLRPIRLRTLRTVFDKDCGEYVRFDVLVADWLLYHVNLTRPPWPVPEARRLITARSMR